MIDVLIVDDEKKIREGISGGIDWAGNGINICGTASSGIEALDMIDKYMPGIIITDISMADMDGLELLEIINQTYPTVKVILISGYKDFEYAQKAIALNAYSYITKPINSQALLEKVVQAKDDIEKRISEVKINDVIRKKLRENILVVRDSFFTTLLEGRIRNKEEIGGRADFLEINLDFKQFLVFIMAFESGGAAKNKNFYDISFYKAAIMSKTEEKISDIYTCHVFNLGARIGGMVCSDLIEKNILTDRMEQIKNWVNNNMGLSLSIGLGNISGSIERITLSYRSASDAADYSMVLGKNVVIDSDKIAESTKEKIAMDDFDSILKTNEDHLISSIKNGELPRIRAILDEIISSVNQIVRNDIRQKERVVFLLAYYLTKTLFSLELQGHRYYGNENNLYAVMNAMTGINDIREFMQDFINEAVAELERTKQSKNSYLVNQAMRMIDDSQDGGITLVSVAERLQIHPSYLSKIFSQETGESFSEHLIKNKMNSARQLLKTTNKKVYEIANDLGYKDVAHFTKIFKKFFGISPTEYRNLM
ncbi:MAG: response regulator [Clostridia bacterium]|nr:response regulator [Clostridia bacterium]